MPDVAHIIQSGGLLLIALIVFAESGMFIGFFFPGDTLLLTAGVFAAQGKLSIATVIIVIAAAAIIGDNCGYLIGRRYGRGLFEKDDGLVFQRDHLHQTERFFNKFGSKAMLFAHFVPVIRTFAPPAAGIANMPHRRFFIYDAIGDIAWAIVITLIGYWFGSKIPNIDHYILIAVAVIMVASLGPSYYHLHKSVRKRNQARNKPKD